MNSNQPTTLTTLCKSLIFIVKTVVSIPFSNLPHRLPQPTTLVALIVKNEVKILYNNNLQRCGVW